MFGWIKKIFGGDDSPTSAPTPKRAQVTPFNLEIGDIVVYLDETYEVGQKIVNHQDGFFWFDYRLTGGHEKHLWLSAEDDDDVVLSLYQPAVFTFPQDGSEPPHDIDLEGTSYTRTERGSADATITRSSGTTTRTTVVRWDYVSTEDPKELFSIQRWGDDEFEAMTGRTILPAALDCMARPDDDIS